MGAKMIHRSILAVLLCASGASAAFAICGISAAAGPQERPVLLEAGSVSTEVCVLVIHRSRMHSQKPIARCATQAELKAMVR